MRRIRYAVAMSLDGYIAGPHGEIDWIVMNPEVDFAALMNEFDTLLAGRRTYEVMMAAGMVSMPGMKTVVVSRTLEPRDHPDVTVVGDNAEEELDAMRRQPSPKPGKDIWLFGGGSLFGSLAAAGLIDLVEVSVMPVLLGTGVPLLPAPSDGIRLSLIDHKVYKT